MLPFCSFTALINFKIFPHEKDFTCNALLRFFRGFDRQDGFDR
jgi:hypothetical protein